MSDLLRILLVEDNPGDAELIEELLAGAGPVAFEIERAPRLSVALERLKTDRIDIVLLDLGLPDSAGLETVRAMQQQAADTPIVVLTGNDDDRTGLAAIQAGAQDFVVKGRISGALLSRVLRYSLERHRDARRLRESEAELRRILEMTPLPLSYADKDGVIIFRNARFIELFGYTPDDVPTESEWWLRAYPDAHYRQRVAETWDAAVKRAVEGGCNIGPAEYRVTCKSGQERLVEINAIILGDNLLTTLIDVSDRKRAVQWERLAREILEALNRSGGTTDTIHEILLLIKQGMDCEAAAIRLQEGDDYPYFVADGFTEDFLRDERYLCVRDESGASIRDAMGNPVLECMCGNVLRSRTDPTLSFFTEAGSFWTNGRMQLLATTTDAELQARTRTRFNREGYESVALIPLRSDGEIIGLLQLNDHRPGRFTLETVQFLEGLGASIGIAIARKRAEAERETLEAQLRQAQKMEAVGRLAGGVAHDFNNMLTVILGCAGLALKQIAPSDPAHADLEQISAAAHRSADLTRQLLAFARKQPIAPRVLDLDDVIAGMLKMLKRLIGEDIDLLWKPAGNLWPVNVDPTQIDQILANLMVNARDAISGVGKITIETGKVEFDNAYCRTHVGSVPGQYVMLAVRDDGCGMDKETQERAFEPFFTTKEPGTGTGLGLATVYGIVKQNSGFVYVESELGKGTTFKIYLPRQQSAQGATDKPCAAAEAPTGTETVLLVEDESAVLAIGRKMLEQLGYNVLAAASPSQAIQVAEQYAGAIHLLLTDIVMPEMNGRELAERLLALRPNLKVLYMSGYVANAISPDDILDSGVCFLQKPFSRDTLAQKVRDALSN